MLPSPYGSEELVVRTASVTRMSAMSTTTRKVLPQWSPPKRAPIPPFFLFFVSTSDGLQATSDGLHTMSHKTVLQQCPTATRPYQNALQESSACITQECPARASHMSVKLGPEKSFKVSRSKNTQRVQDAARGSWPYYWEQGRY